MQLRKTGDVFGLGILDKIGPDEPCIMDQVGDVELRRDRAGGSGHGFKFAPVMGGLITDAVERVNTPYSERFAWRPRGETTTEAIRHTGE